MPCDSRVTETQMVDHERLAEAMTALGFTVTNKEATYVRGERNGRTLSYSRYDKASGFQTSNTNTTMTGEVGRKYAELGARAWAKRAGFSLQETKDEGRTQVFGKRRF